MTKQILVIDDEDGIREIIQFSLEAAAGWTVLMAASGAAGVAIAQTTPPDAILLDIMMPDQDGIETLHQLQANPITQSIPTILLTARAKTSEQQKFLQFGVAGIITKPFQAQNLANQIQAILNW